MKESTHTGIPLSPNYHRIFTWHYMCYLSTASIIHWPSIYSSFHLQMPWWNIHVLNAHAFDNPPPTSICSICSCHFSSRGGRTKHIKTHHPHLANELNLRDSSNPQPPPIPNSSQPISKTPSTSSSTTNHSPISITLTTIGKTMTAPTFAILKMSLKIFPISYSIHYNTILKHQVPYLLLPALTQVLLVIQIPTEIIIIFRLIAQLFTLTLQLLVFIIIIWMVC